MKDVFELCDHYKHDFFFFISQHILLMLYRESYMQDFCSISVRLYLSPYFLPITSLSFNAMYSLPPNTAHLFYRQTS